MSGSGSDECGVGHIHLALSFDVHSDSKGFFLKNVGDVMICLSLAGLRTDGGI